MNYVAYDHVTEWMSDSVPNRQAAEEAADEHNDGCARQHGYGSAGVYAIDADGFLVDEAGGNVWPPHGRTCGAVRAKHPAAVALGRRGGKVGGRSTSAAKQAAARANGAKGGRRPKPTSDL